VAREPSARSPHLVVRDPVWADRSRRRFLTAFANRIRPRKKPRTGILGS